MSPDVFGVVLLFFFVTPTAIAVPQGDRNKPLVFENERVAQAGFFQNPILPRLSDPNVYLHTDGYYYTTTTTNPFITVSLLKSTQLTNWTDAEPKVIFTLSPPYEGLGDPEIHFIRGEWYIYFYMHTSVNSVRMNYVIKAVDSANPFGEYDHPIKLSPLEGDVKAYHGTVMEYDNDRLYFIWAGRFNNTQPISLYVAPMYSPVELSGPSVLLRKPTRPWEIVNASVLEAPQIFKKNGRTFLAFSASSFASPDHCLGMIWIDYGRHPLVPENWWQDIDHCVFSRNDGQHVFGPGRPSFTTSPDGTESWLVYSASDDVAMTKHSIRAERFAWEAAGFPVFPRPAGVPIDHPVPSGQV